MMFAVAIVCAGGCSGPEESVAAAAAPEPDAGKIPVTTASEEARKEYLEGRSLTERLLFQDSLAHFDKAISLDPSFALAELGRANAATTGTEFLDHLKKAVAAVDKVSNGEKLMILAAQAGSDAKATQQRTYLDQLVTAYPRDERAHFTLGTFLFGQQDIAGAIEHFKKANQLAPDYSLPYNLAGYAYRQVADYDNAEKAFKKYIELIPNDPNPYDSYGELLLKMGRFDDSIVQYRKALAIDEHFLASHVGITADLMYSGKTAAAAAEIAQITKKSRSVADQRTALFTTTSLHIYTGNMAQALASLDAQHAVAQKAGDTLGMIGDLQAKATVLTEMGKADDAQAVLEQVLKLTDQSNLPDPIKSNIRLFHHNGLARAALARKDLAAARQHAGAFASAATASGNANQVRQSHELSGMIALAARQWDTAIAELQQANRQNAYNLYRVCQAYAGKGDMAKAKEECTAAAHFNPLPELNFSFIHARAAKMAATGS
jgi:tetratricopeptide (TPR) repeat protein